MRDHNLSQNIYHRIRKQYLVIRILSFLFLLFAAFFIKNTLLLFFLGVAQLFFFMASPTLARSQKITLAIIPTMFIAFGLFPILFVFSDSQSRQLFTIWRICITHESLNYFIYLFLRCFSASLSLLLFMQFISVHELLKGMRKIGISSVIVDLMEQVYKNILLLYEVANQILTAQISRLGYGNAKQKISHSAMLISRTFVLAINEAELHYQGLISRCFLEREQQDKEGNNSDTVIPNNTMIYNNDDMKESPSPIIELTNIHFSYLEGKEVLKGVSFKANRKEKIAFIGVNGSGKSTFFLTLNGIHQPLSGDFFYLGEKIIFSKAQLKMLRRNIGLVFQNSNTQLFTASVYDELAFGLQNIGLDGDDLKKKIDQLIAEYNLQDVLETPPYKLSEGQKKWLNIAAIMAIDPQLVVLDEPSSCLDVTHTEKIIKLTDQWIDQGKTVIISTHDMNLVYSWADRVILFNDGKIVGEGTPDEIFANMELLARTKQKAPLLFSLKEELQSMGVECGEFPQVGYYNK